MILNTHGTPPRPPALFLSEGWCLVALPVVGISVTKQPVVPYISTPLLRLWTRISAVPRSIDCSRRPLLCTKLTNYQQCSLIRQLWLVIVPRLARAAAALCGCSVWDVGASASWPFPWRMAAPNSANWRHQHCPDTAAAAEASFSRRVGAPSPAVVSARPADPSWPM